MKKPAHQHTSKHPIWKHQFCPEMLPQSHTVPPFTSTQFLLVTDLKSLAEQNQL